MIGPPAVLLDVAQALPEERQNVLVIKRIEDHPTLSPRPHDARVSQETQLMRDGGFGHAELEREVTDTQLGAGERIKDSHTCGVAEHAEDLGQPLDSLCIKLGHMNTCSYITTMGLPPQPRFGYDRALGRLNTHVLYELRDTLEHMGPDRSPGGGVSGD